MTKQKLIDAEDEKRRLEEESAQVGLQRTQRELEVLLFRSPPRQFSLSAQM